MYLLIQILVNCQPNKTGFVKEIIDPELPSVELAIDHLKTGYNNIIELWNTIKSDFPQYENFVLIT